LFSKSGINLKPEFTLTWLVNMTSIN